MISQAQDWAEEGSWGRGAKARKHIQVLSGQGRHPDSRHSAENPGGGKALVKQGGMMARPLTVCVISGRFVPSLSFRFLIHKVGN